MISKIEIHEFVKEKSSEIVRGECDRNTFLFYEAFKGRGVSIREGIADSYRDDKRTGTHQHFWNVITIAGESGVDDQIVDIYSIKPDREIEYRNHRDEKTMSGDELKRLIDSRPFFEVLASKAI